MHDGGWASGDWYHCNQDRRPGRHQEETGESKGPGQVHIRGNKMNVVLYPNTCLGTENEKRNGMSIAPIKHPSYKGYVRPTIEQG